LFALPWKHNLEIGSSWDAPEVEGEIVSKMPAAEHSGTRISFSLCWEQEKVLCSTAARSLRVMFWGKNTSICVTSHRNPWELPRGWMVASQSSHVAARTLGCSKCYFSYSPVETLFCTVRGKAKSTLEPAVCKGAVSFPRLLCCIQSPFTSWHRLGN